jgi:hypothetical protein
MKSFNNLSKKEKLAGVYVTILFVGLTVLSIYGLFLDSFIYESRRTTYFFFGFNKVVFCLSSLLLNGTMALILSGGYLVSLGVLAKRKPGSLNGKLVLFPMFLGFTGIVYSSIVAGSINA